jgi:hypothetical protein
MNRKARREVQRFYLFVVYDPDTQASLGFLYVQEVLGRESTEYGFPYNNKCLVIRATFQDTP